MKNYYLTFTLAFCITLMTLIASCGSDYDEGDEVVKQRFEKMTSQEKIIYNAVQNVWGTRRLKPIREAVARRETRPIETNLPFQDIAGVIKTNNNVTLTLDSSWQTSTKNKYIMARWDRVDEEWYRKLLLSIGIKDIVKEDLIPEEKVIEEKKSGEKPISDTIMVNDHETQQDEVKINIKDIIPESKYDDLYYEIKNCDKAVFTYKQIINDRVLTWEDYELLIRISIGCKAQETLSKLENN